MLPAQRAAAFAWLVLALALPSCGGSDSNPVGPSQASNAATAGTILTIASGESDRPIAGATITVGGRSYTTSASGEVTLAEAVTFNTPADIIAGGYLDRQTAVRRDLGTRFSLWPKNSPAGLDENQTAELVYSNGSFCCPASHLAAAPLGRVASSISTFTVTIDPAWRGNASNVQAVVAAANAATAVTDGLVVFGYGEAPSGPTIEIVTGEDPRPIVAFADTRLDARGYIVGGRIGILPEWGKIFFGADRRTKTDATAIVAHELGHFLGLQHSSKPGIMGVSPSASPYAYYSRNRGFSTSEALAFQLMSQRPAGNRFPDNDREARFFGGPRTTRIGCELEGE